LSQYHIISLVYTTLGHVSTGLANCTIIEAAREHITYIRQIKIKPVLGQAIHADVVNTNIRLANKQHTPYITIYCAVSPDVNDNMILTADVEQRLAHAHNQKIQCFDETVSHLKAESMYSDYTCNNKTDPDSDMHYVEQVFDLCNYRSADNVTPICLK
jgi:hypothetical protein